MTKKHPTNHRAKANAVALGVKPLDGDAHVAASGMRFLPPRLPVAPLKQLQKELDQDRKDRD